MALLSENDNRCPWCGDDPIYVDYHDNEWGVPLKDSRALWEMLILEGFQSGLSWITILKKRNNFRTAFRGFDPNIIAAWGENEVAKLLQDKGIVRSRLKIEATIHNAQSYLALSKRLNFSDFIWSHVKGQPLQNVFEDFSEIPATTPLSEKLSKDLKKLGFKFCGPTIVYAFMQSVGLVNDHLVECPCYEKIKNFEQSS